MSALLDHVGEEFEHPCKGVSVELSIAIVPGFQAAKCSVRRIQPDAPRSLVVAEHRNDDELAVHFAASLGVAAAWAPDAASLFAASGVRFQAVSWWPAFNRLAAIREPIAPSPRNPILLIQVSPFRSQRSRPALFVLLRLRPDVLVVGP